MLDQRRRRRSWRSRRLPTSPRIVAPVLSMDAAADPRRTTRQCLLPADGDVLHDCHIITDDGEGAHDDAGCMIEKHLRSDRSGRMNADLKRIRRQACSNNARSVRS